jgi:hypothetical protein
MYRKSTDSEPSKAAEQQPVIMQMTPSLAAVSTPPPLAEIGLTTCSNANARSSAQQIFW